MHRGDGYLQTHWGEKRYRSCWPTLASFVLQSKKRYIIGTSRAYNIIASANISHSGRTAAMFMSRASRVESDNSTLRTSGQLEERYFQAFIHSPSNRAHRYNAYCTAAHRHVLLHVLGAPIFGQVLFLNEGIQVAAKRLLEELEFVYAA